MDLTERTLHRREIYRGRILEVHVDQVSLPNGGVAAREIVEHPGGVGILALDDQHRVALVRQYRYAFSRVVTEIPAGKLESGEDDPLAAAKRELQEEIGAAAAHWESLGTLLPSPGCYAEVLHLFLARQLTFTAPRPDEDEFLESEWMPLGELAAQCLRGEIQDAKTVAAVLKAVCLFPLTAAE